MRSQKNNMEEEHRKTDNIILEEISKLRDEFKLFKEDIDTRMAPLDKMRGFWSVLGFLLGGVALLATGLAGMVYIYKFVINHIK